MVCEAHLSDPREAPKASSALNQPWLQMDQICALETHQALLYNTLVSMPTVGVRMLENQVEHCAL